MAPRDPDAAGAVLGDGQDVDFGVVEGGGDEDVQRHDPLRLGPQEPAQPGPSRRGAGSVPALLRVCQSDGATVVPSPASSPWTGR